MSHEPAQRNSKWSSSDKRQEISGFVRALRSIAPIPKVVFERVGGGCIVKEDWGPMFWPPILWLLGYFRFTRIVTVIAIAVAIVTARLMINITCLLSA